MYSQKSDCCKCIRGPIGPQGPQGPQGEPGEPGTPSPGAIIPYASGSIPITLVKTEESNLAAAVGLGSSEIANINPNLIDSNTKPYLIGFAYTMPRDGFITNISGNFTLTTTEDFTNNPAVIAIQIYTANPSSSTFTPNGFGFATFPILAGLTNAGTTIYVSTDISISVPIGQQVLLILLANSSLNSVSISGIFSGGINII